MISRRMALSYLNQAGHILEEAESWSSKKRWNMVIRRSQEAVENK
jgi:HEPN domain-containing protein